MTDFLLIWWALHMGPHPSLHVSPGHWVRAPCFCPCSFLTAVAAWTTRHIRAVGTVVLFGLEVGSFICLVLVWVNKRGLPSSGWRCELLYFKKAVCLCHPSNPRHLQKWVSNSHVPSVPSSSKVTGNSVVKLSFTECPPCAKYCVECWRLRTWWGRRRYHSQGAWRWPREAKHQYRWSRQ